MATSTELKSKASELRKIADKLDEAAKALASLDSGNGSFFPIPIATATATTMTRPPELGDLAGESGVKAIQRVMVDVGHPLSKPEILKRLKARGKAIAEGTLVSYLSREKELFRSYGAGKWGLNG